jgi:hypothetical protein
MLDRKLTATVPLRRYTQTMIKTLSVWPRYFPVRRSHSFHLFFAEHAYIYTHKKVYRL